MRRLFTIVLLAVLCWGAGSARAQQVLQDADSLGNLWVVTADLSGSMIDGGHFPGATVGAKAQYMARQLKPRLLSGHFFDSVDYTRDDFIFFTSGYLYGKLKKGEPSLDSCFIHHTDGLAYHFASRDELVAHICGLLDYSRYRYKYKQSFVSQIAPFSAVKASRYISKRNWGTRYKSMYVVTLTDDAEGTLQWMNDFNNIRHWDAKKADEISDITSRYLYNSLTGTGKGRMSELMADENGHVHVRSYRYELLGAVQPPLIENEIVRVKARNGSEMHLSIPPMYNSDTVRYVQIDSVCANGRMFRVGKKFMPDDGDADVPVTYDIKRFKNDFTVYGCLQLAYQDSLWGTHLRKVYFEQDAKLMPGRTISRIVIGSVAGGLVLILALLIWLVWLPRTRLLNIQIGDREYKVLHGHRSKWKREGTQLLSCKRKNDDIYEVLLSSRSPMLKKVATKRTKEESIVIRSRFNLNFINDPSLRDGTLAYASFNTEKSKTGGEHIYTLTKVGKGVIAIALPLVRKPILIGIEEDRVSRVTNVFQILELMVLQEYLHLDKGGASDAIVAHCYHDNFFYWSVVVPEYDNGSGLPLSQARVLFSYRHPAQGISDVNIKQFQHLLIQQIRNEHPEFRKISAATVSHIKEWVQNSGHFKVFHPISGGYLCACENVQSKPSLQTLYSPMGSDWDSSCVAVSVRRMRSGKGTLVCSFLPISVLRKAFPQGIPPCLWYGVGSPLQSPHTPQLLSFTEDSDCQHIVFHGQKYDGNRIAVPATKLSFDIIVKQTFSY